jgi:hypothetical protein
MRYLVATVCLALVGGLLLGSVGAPKTLSFVDGPYPQRHCSINKDITGAWSHQALCDDGNVIYLTSAQIERLMNRR